MTSGPMPTGALPPEPQPDPQVEPNEDPRRDALRCIECEFRADDSPGGWYDLSEHRTATGHKYEHVRPARKPLTPADIPAGQGAASLYRDTDGAVWFKEANGYQRIVLLSPDEMSRETPSGQALEAFLAATLPTVTEDAS